MNQFGAGGASANSGGGHPNHKPHHHASGTSNAPGGWSMVGERGPELVNLKSGSTVLDAQRSAAAMGGGGSPTFNFYGVYADKASIGKALDEALSAFYQRSGRVTSRR